ncbi:hypothetical protein ALC57_09444 [Trachymyrmex cornetzi]|uniref:Uncharacterized protein n=1 Tax=Trachymyrmex cornetzi TaxID=471704 RepID=A0A151J5E4_9HYME|nr:hypothetical protein ALC57_09444 [Trachymyrmex cornetzi]
MEGERRDHEIIVFGLPESVSEDAAALMTVLASFLGLTLAPEEIVASFRIPVRVPPVVGRLLRYDLTSTGYKYLEIGINVGPPSYVNIALGDHRGHELSLSLETWKGLCEQRWNIYKMLRNEYKDNFKSVGPLTVRIFTLQSNATLVRLDSSSVRMMMTETTLHRIFEFDGCIDVTFERLVRLVDMVDAKYTRFSNIGSKNAIRDSDIFNGHQLVDCELLALVF